MEGAGARKPLVPGDGMFERFGGVFHAFEKLREYVEKAVHENRPHDAEYRLFGAKYDSLPVLLDKVLVDGVTIRDDPTTDLAVRYATLLSAQRLLRQLEGSIEKFLEGHPEDLRNLQSKFAAGTSLRARVAGECGTQGESFVSWFDDWFRGSRDRGEQ